MTIHAVIDTNVLVSSMITKNKRAATYRLIDALIDNKYRVVYNTDIINEYKEVLARKEFNIDKEAVKELIGIILKTGLLVPRTPSNEPVIDPKDVVFYEVALSKEGAYLVTGNLRHFPKKPIVVTPSEMMTILEDAGLVDRLH